MINIFYTKCSLLFLIVINIQLFVAQENTGFDVESDEEGTKSEETKPIVHCTDVLPVIKDGKYIITSKNSDNDHISLKFVCNDDNFVLSPPIRTDFCVYGEWYRSGIFPECLPVCNNENWNSSWTKCVPDCGLRNQPDASLTANELQLGDFPYHVGIYFKLKTKDKNELKYVCGGTIISTQIVVTAAYCVTLPENGTVTSLDMYDVFVGAGKYYSDYESTLDTNAHKRQAIHLELAEKNFYQTASDYDHDLAVIVVEKPFIFDNFVQPVCVDWFNGFNTDSYAKNNHIGYVVGWGDNKYKASTSLNIRLVTYILKLTIYRETIIRDENYITSKKICTNSEQGCDICVGDVGSGLVFARNSKGVTKYYIRNVVSGSGLDTNICGNTTTTRYTEVFNTVEFLIKKLDEYPNVIYNDVTSALSKSTNCRVPFISNGRLLISGKEYTSRRPIPNHSIIYIDCNEDTYLYPPFTKYVICQEGKFSTKVPKCSRKCPPLIAKTIEFTCELNGVVTDCTSPSFEGTIVTMLCIQDYLNRFGGDQYAAAVCRDGDWDQPFLTCEPQCSHRMEFSQVDIYQNISNYSDDPKGKYICGGSIISDNIILSAAQCFTNESTGELLNLESFFLYPPVNPNSTRKILDVKIPQEYKGKLSNFTGNLALIKLDLPLPLAGGIRIACFEEPIDYLEELKHARFRSGATHGRYYSEEASEYFASNALKPTTGSDYLTINVYNLTECIYDVTKGIETNDKFCAGQLIGRSVPIYFEGRYLKSCFASPGAGFLTIGRDGVYKTFLQGVASFHRLNKSCTDEAEKYLFTALEKYQQFLKSGIEELSICKIPDIQNSSFTVSERNYRINESIPNFSIVRVKCDNGFQIFPPFFYSMICNNGTYDKKIPYCVQCGQIRQSNLQDNSTDGVNASHIPWQVKIYQNTTYKCGGSLINPRIIITNSLCFPDTNELFHVIVGKQNVGNFKQKHQSVNKEEVVFLDELALVILKHPFILNEYVQPICIDWKDKFGYQEMTSSQPGIIVSSNNNHTCKSKNKTWKQEILSDVDSSKQYLQQYKNSLLPNYFSAKQFEGTNVCVQDVGSGIAMKNEDGVYFLRGVFTPISNESLPFCTFIKISYYLPFIIQTVETIELL